MERKQGDRVCAISHTDDEHIYLYGYGVYEGKEVPPKNVGGLNIGIPNPKIRLDNGDVVYGCECWWGTVEGVKKMLDGDEREIVYIKPKRG